MAVIAFKAVTFRRAVIRHAMFFLVRDAAPCRDLQQIVAPRGGSSNAPSPSMACPIRECPTKAGAILSGRRAVNVVQRFTGAGKTVEFRQVRHVRKTLAQPSGQRQATADR